VEFEQLANIFKTEAGLARGGDNAQAPKISARIQSSSTAPAWSNEIDLFVKPKGTVAYAERAAKLTY
jgi:hypothetical protein